MKSKISIAAILMLGATLTVSSTAAEAPRETYRYILGADYEAIQAVVRTVVKKEGKLDVSKYEIVVFEVGEEIFVTFQPADLAKRAYVGSSDEPNLEAIVLKKTMTVHQWYWSDTSQR